MIEAAAMTEPGKPPLAARAEALPPPRGTVDIRRLLHWAIGHQKAHRIAFAAGAFDADRWIYGTAGVDSVAIIESIGRLGTTIDTTPGWQPRNTGCDEDAAKVFEQVQACLRDWRIYRLVMAHAELGTEPDWKPGARTRAEPVSRDAQGRAVESKHSVEYPLALWRMRVRDPKRGGRFIEYDATGGRPSIPGHWRVVKWFQVRVDHVRFTPIAWHDEAEDVVEARLAYRQWHAALRDIAGALNATPSGPHALERWSRITHLAPAHPWPVEDDALLGRLAAEIRNARREWLQQGAAAPNRGRLDTSGLRPLDKEGGY